ncbi:tyrosine-type recombinase/integrase [Flavobacterium sp.]|uniref:tyrosine-type recombinase/integrase n=1 Tax=Flavobacterium sp. TaxID=239 RepID=UPI0035288A98
MKTSQSNIQAYTDYLSKEKNFSKHTIKAYTDDIDEFNNFTIQNFETPAENANYSLIRSWIVALVDSGITPNSVNRKISSLKSFYKFLLKIKEISVNPLLKHKSLKTAKKVQVPFSEKEMNEVFEMNNFPDDFEGIRNQLIIELLYTTGIRRTELIELKLSDVDFSRKTLKVLGKRNKERYLPLLNCTIAILHTYINLRQKLENITDDKLLILSKKGNKLSQSFVYRLINSYFSNVSQKVKKSPHVLRHTFATHLLNNGADLNSVKELLGHASLSSTQIYTHSSLAELQKVYKEAHPRGE